MNRIAMAVKLRARGSDPLASFYSLGVTCGTKRKFAEVNASLVLNFCDLITGKAVPDPGSGRFGHGACPAGSEQQLLPGVFS